MIKLSKHNDMKLDIGFKSLLNKQESPNIFLGWWRAYFRWNFSVFTRGEGSLSEERTYFAGH